MLCHIVQGSDLLPNYAFVVQSQLRKPETLDGQEDPLTVLILGEVGNYFRDLDLHLLLEVKLQSLDVHGSLLGMLGRLRIHDGVLSGAFELYYILI